MAVEKLPLLGSIYIENNGYPEQERVYRDARDLVRPFEEPLNQLAAQLATKHEMPVGVQKRRKKTYSFQTLDRNGERRDITIKAKKHKARNEWLCHSFSFDNNEIQFNQEGKIIY